MARPFSLFATPFVLVALLAAIATAQDYTVQVASTQSWTDSGLDLRSGNMLTLSAAPAAGSTCDPDGVNSDPAQATLPMATAPQGALIARLHAQGAAPILIGAGTQLTIEETSHLFLGMNFATIASCQGSITVKIHRDLSANAAGEAAPAQNSAATSGAAAPGAAPATAPKSRNEQLKSQLSSAAQVFMSGQFGTGKSESTSSTTSTGSNSLVAGDTSSAAVAPAITISTEPLDAALRRSIDTLPRRVNDQFQNLGDMVNFVIVGSQKDVQAALDAATWHVADTDNRRAVLNALMQTYEQKDYLAMPMSTLYLFGRKQDFGYEMAEPIAMVASRHHFRIWKAPFTWQGNEVWVGAGTHDIGFAKDQRNSSVTHKIDPAVDGERDNIGSSLQRTNKTKTMSYYLPSNPVQDARNATGDGYHSDGRLLIVVLP